MFAGFKKKWNLLNDLIVTCYHWGWCFWGDRTCVPTLLLVVSC